MADSLGAARGSIEIDIAQALASLRQVEGALGSFDKASANVGAKLNQSFSEVAKQSQAAGVALTAVGATIGAAFGFGIKAAVGFEDQMAAVQAVTGATGEEFTSLSDKAIQIGKDTAFGAGEAAFAIEELAKAGVSVETILSGAADATVALAAAGGVDLASAATVMSNAMNQFGLEGSDAALVADLFAASAAASSTGVLELGESMKMVGTVANVLGVSIQDTVTALSLFANAGITGSSAGTALNAVLRDITKTSAVEKFQELGVSVFDLAGELRPLPDVMKDLQVATAGMSTDAKKSFLTLAGIGDESLKGLLILLESTSDGAVESGKSWQDMYEGVTEGGVAAQQAAARLDSFQGALTIMQGSLETVAIVMFQRLLPALRIVVEGITTFLNILLTLPDGVQTVIVAVAGITGILAGLAGAFILIGPRIIDAVKAFKLLAASAQVQKVLAGTRLGLVGLLGPLALLGAAYAAYQTNFLGFGDKVRSVGSDLQALGQYFWSVIKGTDELNDYLSYLPESLQNIVQPIGFIVGTISEFIQVLVGGGGLRAALSEVFGRFQAPAFDAIVSNLKEMGGVYGTVLGGILEGVGNFVTGFGNAWNSIGGTVTGFTDPIYEANSVLGDLRDSLQATVTGFTDPIYDANSVLGDLRDSLQATGESLSSVEVFFTSLAAAIRNIGGEDGAPQFLVGLADFLENVGPKVATVVEGITGFLDRFAEAWRGVEEAVAPVTTQFGMAHSAIRQSQTAVESITEPLSTVARFFDALSTALRGVGDGNVGWANALADGLGVLNTVLHTAWGAIQNVAGALLSAVSASAAFMVPILGIRGALTKIAPPLISIAAAMGLFGKGAGGTVGIVARLGGLFGGLAPRIALLAARFLGLTNPIGLIANALGLLYLAYQRNFLGFGDGVRRVLGLLGEGFGKLTAPIQQVVRMFQGLRDYGLGPVEAAVRALSFTFPALSGVFKAVGKAITKITDVAGDLADYFGNALDSGQALNKGLTAFSKGPVRNLVRFLGEIVVGVQSIITAFGEDGLSGAVVAAGRAFGRIGDAFKAFAASVLGADIARFLVAGFNLLMAPIRAVIGLIAGLVSAFQDGGLGGAVRALPALIVGAFAEIGAAIGAFFLSALAAGDDFWNLLVDGIDAAFGMVWDALQVGISLAWDQITSIDWGAFVSSLSWAAFVAAINLSDFVVGLAWDLFIIGIDLWERAPMLLWSAFVIGVDLGRFVLGLIWDIFVVGVRLGDYVKNLDWTTFVWRLVWGSFITGVKLGEFVFALTWSTFVTGVALGTYVRNLPWKEYVTAVVLSDFVIDLAWSAFVTGVKLINFVKDLAWDAFVTAIAWVDFIPDVLTFPSAKEILDGIVNAVKGAFDGGGGDDEKKDITQQDDRGTDTVVAALPGAGFGGGFGGLALPAFDSAGFSASIGAAAGGLELLRVDLDQFTAAMPAFVESIKAPIRLMRDDVINAFGAMVTGAMTHLTAWQGTAGSVSAATVEAVKVPVRLMVIDVPAAFAAMTAATGETMGGWVTNSGALSGAAMEAIKVPVRQMVIDVPNAFTEMASQASANLSNGLSGIPGIVSAISGATANAAYLVGINVADALAAGVNDRLWVVQNAVNSLVATVNTGMEYGFQISSPSKVFARYGGNLSEGLAIGIEDMIPRAERAALTLADRVNRAAQAIAPALSGLNMSGASTAMDDYIGGITNEGDWLNDALGGIPNGKKYVDAMQKVWLTPARDALKNYMRSIIDEGKFHGDYLNDWLTYLPKDLQSTFLEWGKMIADGMEHGVPAVEEAVKKLVNRTTGALSGIGTSAQWATAPTSLTTPSTPYIPVNRSTSPVSSASYQGGGSPVTVQLTVAGNIVGMDDFTDRVTAEIVPALAQAMDEVRRGQGVM